MQLEQVQQSAKIKGVNLAVVMMVVVLMMVLDDLYDPECTEGPSTTSSTASGTCHVSFHSNIVQYAMQEHLHKAEPPAT